MFKNENSVDHIIIHCQKFCDWNLKIAVLKYKMLLRRTSIQSVNSINENEILILQIRLIIKRPVTYTCDDRVSSPDFPSPCTPWACLRKRPTGQILYIYRLVVLFPLFFFSLFSFRSFVYRQNLGDHRQYVVADLSVPYVSYVPSQYYRFPLLWLLISSSLVLIIDLLTIFVISIS
jgi:hypothetical protein